MQACGAGALSDSRNSMFDFRSGAFVPSSSFGPVNGDETSRLTAME
jgi:hypothetical protein